MAQAQANMNVLLIEADQMRWDVLGVNSGGLVQTPNLDALAARGVNFTNAYCNSPLCGPSRGSSVTGRWPHETGAYANASPFDGRVPTYAHHLRTHGVAPHDIGRMDFRRGCDHGFEALLEHPRQNLDIAEWMRNPIIQRVGGYRKDGWSITVFDEDRNFGPVDEVCEWLQHHSADTDTWQLFINFNLPHPPYRVPRHYLDRYDPARTPMPLLPEGFPDSLHEAMKVHRYHWNVEKPFPDEDIRYKRTLYFAMTTWLDAMLGKVLDTLAEQGLDRDTLVIFTSDHGEHLGDRGLWEKGCFYDSAARIPLVVAGPGVPQDTTVDTPVSLIDLAPTICEAFGVPPLPGARGHSLLPLARGESSLHPGVAFGEYHGHDAVAAEFMVCTPRWKYIHYIGLPAELFDLEHDPSEMHDLGNDPRHAATRAELEALLRTRFDMERIDAEVRRDQAHSFRSWLETVGRDAAHAELREVLGDRQFEKLRPVYQY